MPSLVPKQTLRTSFGDIAYLEAGDAAKPPVLFVHGIPTSGYLWRHVIRFLQQDYHCYAPDLMGLGDTLVDTSATRFTMDCQAEMLLEFMTALGHDSFALVCHDQGGAAAQLIAARQPHRVTAFVLTDCVCYDNWPVPAIRRLQRMARNPLGRLIDRTGLPAWLETNTRLSAFRRGVYDPTKLPAETIREYLRPMTSDRQGQERFRQFLLAGDSRYSELAVDGLRQFDKPTMVLWAADDYYLSPSWGKKLYEEIPGANRFELIPFCGHFWQEERPAEFASYMSEFFGAHLVHSASDTSTPSDGAGEGKLRANGAHSLPVLEQAGS